jgi:DNA-binding GntR family transcriptional regulator
MLLDYRLVPGQRLVFIDLANKLGVSRTTINNALSILASQGYLDFVHNQGYRVHEITREEAESLFEIRIYMEMCATEKIFDGDNITDEKIGVLEQKNRLYKENALEGVSRASFILNEQFHMCYIEMAGNKYLTDYIREINQKVFVRHRVEGYQMKRTLEVIEEHDRILNAIKDRKRDDAKAAIRSHILAGQDYIFKKLFA